jgi:hypothetical protein
MPLFTAQDFIGRALRHCVQTRPGYVAGPELLADVLTEWAALYDQWDLDRNMSLTRPEFIYPVISSGFRGNHRDYSIGPTGADFTGPRPIKILKANLLISTVNPAARTPLAVIPFRDYGDIPVLTVPPTGITEAIFYEATFPNGILHFWPPINSNSVEIWQNNALVAPVNLGDDVSFPPGYQDAVVFSLAERSQYLCTKEMGKLNPKIAGWALKARQRIKNANTGNPKVLCDFRSGDGASGAYDPNLTYIGDI